MWSIVLLFLVIASVSSNVVWKADVVEYITKSIKLKAKKWSSTLTIQANGPIFTGDLSGHFRMNISAFGNFTEFYGQSECISINANPIQATATINSIQFSKYGTFLVPGSDDPSVNTTHVSYEDPVPFTDVFSVSVKKSSNAVNYTVSMIMAFTSISNAADSAINSMHVNISLQACAAPKTLGQWNDALRWSGGRVPNTTDTVIIPAGSGIIQLSNSVTVGNFDMLGGLLLSYTTSCPTGWTPDTIGANGIKCYLLHQELKNFEQAEGVCNSVGFSSADAHLMQVRNRLELASALRLCRGPVGSPAYVHGCWIGLKDAQGSGDFDWIAQNYVGSSTLFLDWRRGEPNNHTSSDGIPTNGELCGKIIAWQEDPLIQEQGSWNDESCNVAKPFVCQIYATTNRYTLTVSNKAALLGGAMEGGYLVADGPSQIMQFTAQRTAIITLTKNATLTAIRSLSLTDGAELVIDAPVVDLLDGAFIGEALPDPDDDGPPSGLMQPRVSTALGVLLQTPIHGMVSFNARVSLLGTFNGAPGSYSNFFQGGEFSQSHLQLTGGAIFAFDGYGARLSSIDAFELTLSNRGSFLGEYYGETSSAKELSNIHDLNVTGVYRLSVAEVSNGTIFRPSFTRCIPYNATAAQVQEYLDDLPLIQARGGVTVRRYGSHTSGRFGYGFTYRIELDAPQTDVYSLGPIVITERCYGLGTCGCAETKVPLTDPSGNENCPSDIGVISAADPNSCVLPPTITVTRISAQSFTATSGDGRVVINSGTHRLPPVTQVFFDAYAGVGIVAADVINWYGLSARTVGRLVFAGTGWWGWDAANVLYAPDWTTERGLVRELAHAPPFNMNATYFYLDGYGSVLSACPTSNITWSRGVWAGGFIGGRSTLFLADVMDATGTNKALRFGITLYIKSQARLNWYDGNISLADGADIILEGLLQINATAAPVFIGMSQLLAYNASQPNANVSRDLLQQAGGRNYHSYYGDELVAELRGGWYQNPLCGDQCLDTPQILVRGFGLVVVADNSNVNFYVPLNLLPASNMRVGHDVGITLQSGGTCGNGVVIDINYHTVLTLSGGQMEMQALCSIRGQGELLVVAGRHDLAFSIDAHITIRGGTMVWPLSRGAKGTLTFNGGLLIESTGKLSVEPQSTDILVHNTVELRNSSVIAFPLQGVASQASPYDERDAPDTSPRGIFTATGIMRWDGGTLLGKADFVVQQALYLDGELKQIQSLAKLVNMGHCEWGTGNILAENNGDFVNFGTIQMIGGVAKFESSAMYKGTEIPIDNGGDVFAQSYHSYDMDNGRLSYDQYVTLRTEFVSRAPSAYSTASAGGRR